MRKILLLIVIALLIPFFNSHGQDSIPSQNSFTFLEFGVGITSLTDEYIMYDKKQMGVSASIRVRFENKSRRFAITPMLGMRDYLFGIEGEEYDNVLLAVRLGAIFDYNIYKNNISKFYISNFIELCYSNYRYFFREESGTELVQTQNGMEERTTYNTKTIYRAEAPSIVLGYKLRYKYFFTDIGYDIVKSHIKYADGIYDGIKQNSPNAEEHPGYIFNSFNLHIGFSIPFNKITPGGFYY